MRLIIDISEEEMKYPANIIQAVRNGKPLPKGHGRIMDVDKIIKKMEEREEQLKDNRSMYETSCVETALDMFGETIIEADKRSEDKMSNTKICDRCGQTIKLFDDELSYKNEAWRYEITKDCHPYSDKIKIDLCSDCKKDLVRWLKR